MRKIHWLFCLLTIALSKNVFSEKIIFNSNSHIGYISIDISGTGCTGKIYWQNEDTETEHEKSVDLVNCFVEPNQKDVRVKVSEADTAGSKQLLNWHPQQSSAMTGFISQYE
ncbi:MAG: hypothetical protein KTR17_12735 [Cellvibrionaceae bacterium]|nr:hypothetical protein [Cellvibrionaceae bacterium]